VSKYRCGKCGSGGLYRDEDFEAGFVYIACTICGNRWPGGVKPVDGQKNQDIRPEIKEDAMQNRTGPCANCKRVRTYQGGGHCFLCNRASKGLEGEERSAALAAIKEQIEKGGRPKKAMADPAIAPAGGKTKKKVEERDSKKQKSGTIDAGILQDRKGKVEGKAQKDADAIYLKFSDERDRALYAALYGESVRMRRSVEQQLMFIIQVALEMDKMDKMDKPAPGNAAQ
jgi:hypothetical protein